MSDTMAAPEDRFVIGDPGVSGCYVLDRVLGGRVGPSGLTWAAAHIEAQRLNREARKPPACAPAAPRCDCAEKLKAAEETAERYRHALAQIWRHGSGPALRYAHDALFGTERAKGAAA